MVNTVFLLASSIRRSLVDPQKGILVL